MRWAEPAVLRLRLSAVWAPRSDAPPGGSLLDWSEMRLLFPPGVPDMTFSLGNHFLPSPSTAIFKCNSLMESSFSYVNTPPRTTGWSPAVCRCVPPRRAPTDHRARCSPTLRQQRQRTCVLLFAVGLCVSVRVYSELECGRAWFAMLTTCTARHCV